MSTSAALTLKGIVTRVGISIMSRSLIQARFTTLVQKFQMFTMQCKDIIVQITANQGQTRKLFQSMNCNCSFLREVVNAPLWDMRSEHYVFKLLIKLTEF